MFWDILTYVFVFYLIYALFDLDDWLKAKVRRWLEIK